MKTTITITNTDTGAHLGQFAVRATMGEALDALAVEHGFESWKSLVSQRAIFATLAARGAAPQDAVDVNGQVLMSPEMAALYERVRPFIGTIRCTPSNQKAD